MALVAVVAFDGVVPFDLTTPCEIFGRVRLASGRHPYDVRVCGTSRSVDAGSFSLQAPQSLSLLSRADTVVVPGMADVGREVSAPLKRALRSAAERGARVMSICTGAFVLAECGLLDGLRATTHWLGAAELARRYPRVTVDPNVLYVDSGNILTSAGAAAGLDLCLHVVRRDHGAAVAAQVARASVMPLERAGGQAQFIEHAPAVSASPLAPLLAWMAQNLHRDLSLAQLAKRAALSTRSLSRHFLEQTGTSPRQWLVHARVRRAQVLLETHGDSVERIAERVGFGAAGTLREQFQRVVGTSPQAYRRAFRSTPEKPVN